MSDDQNEGTDLVRKLRAEIDRISAERDEYKTQVRDSVIGDTFQQYGLQPDKGAGRLAAQAYDGELSPGAVQAWLDDQGFEVTDDQGQSAPPEGMDRRVEQRKTLDRISNDSAPAATGQRMSVEEHKSLLKADPKAAMKAYQEGRVDFKSPAAATPEPRQSLGL